MPEFIEQTLGGLLETQAEQHPDREFIVYADRDLRWTYKTFNARVDAMAKGFLAMGL